MIVVIADDLSGAAELAGAAVRHGLSAEVQTEFTPGAGADVVCVDTDTRLLPPEQAARQVEAVARSVVAARPDWIFKKCDSVLRGPVVAEARAVARIAGRTGLRIVSANPTRGRIVRDGCYFIDGQPLHETTFARDPSHPCTTSRIADLLGGDLAGIETPDVQTMAGVRQQAATLPGDTLPVGAADFFAALLESRVPSRPAPPPSAAPADPAGATLAVCGSAASWAQRRQEAVARHIPVFALPHDVAGAIRAMQSSHRILLGIGDHPASRGVSPAVLLNQLAAAVAIVVRQAPVTRLLLEGGATTAAVVRALGWSRLQVCQVSAPGIGALRPVNSTGPILFIKPGSYAWPEEIWPN